MNSPRLVGVFALVAAMLGCEKAPVEWQEVVYSDLAPDALSAAMPVGIPDKPGCMASVRTARNGTTTHAIWWSVRPDSSAILRYATFPDSGDLAPVSIDTTDRSRRGCNRPAPALAADDQGRVYVAYFMEPTSGPGIFFAHKMDDVGFHDPISISYGKRASAVSMAVAGDRVAVAYEEPNTERGQIWIALSASMGHLFEYRGAVSGPSEIARRPRVNLSGTKLDVTWAELIQSDSSGKARQAQRTGIWK